MSNYLEVFGLCGWESDDATEEKVSTEGTEDNVEFVLEHMNLDYQSKIHLEISSILLGGPWSLKIWNLPRMNTERGE